MKKPRNTGIPTIYNGIQFRSRLEARWACFMDLCGWSWQYEPMELPGWIPDFRVTAYGDARKSPDGSRWVHEMDRSRDFILEVRPVGSREGLVDKFTKAQSGKEWMKVLLVGEGPEDNGGWLDKLGDLYTHHGATLGPSMVEIGVLHVPLCDYQPPLSLPENSSRPCPFPIQSSSEDMIFHQDMILSFIERESKDDIRALWKQAGNKTQWKGVQNP